MHEVSLCQNLVALMQEEATRQGFTRVRTVHLELGALSCVEPAALRFAFDSCARGSCADGAGLEIDIAPARAWCWSCTATVEVAAHASACPNCGSGRVQLVEGEQMRLRELEVQ